MYTMAITKRKLNFQTHNDLQASHVISIFAAFQKIVTEKNCNANLQYKL